MGFIASLDRRRLATALVALAIAFLSGYVMQNVLADNDGVATIKEGPDAAPVLRRGESQRPLPTPPAATLTPILAPPPVMPHRTEEAAVQEQEARGDNCRPQVLVENAPAATLKITVEARCHGGARVVVAQGPMRVDDRLDGDGRLETSMPALSGRSDIEVRVEEQTVTVEAEVPDAGDYQHVALLWDGVQALRINAYEFGAKKSQFGHVWSGSPKTISRAMRGSGGYLTRLGSGDGAGAEVYSFPAGHSPLRGVVRLVVEAEVTRANCGRVLKATALQTGPLGRMSETEVALDMPGCDHLGEIIRLQNLLQDMRLAGR